VADGEPDFQRARRPEQKEQRRATILRAARELALRDGVRKVTLGGIAERAGIHKSAVLRYFETREEIYLHLTAQSWTEWGAALSRQLTTEAGADALAAVLTETLVARPLFCELLSHVSLTLERRVSLRAVREFKLMTLDEVSAISRSVIRTLPDLDEHRAWDVVAAVTGLAGTLWQVANPPDTLTELYRQDPRLAHHAAEFGPRLHRLSHALILGLIRSPQLDD
jgi:AcrR family transcriptional regulator